MTTFFIACSDTRWQVARCDGRNVDLRAVEITADTSIAAALVELGYAGGAVCLGLPSRKILPGAIDCGSLPRKGRRDAMRFRLEEHVPLNVEDLTVDFVPLPGDRALGLAVETEKVRPICDTLTGTGINIATICPTALLALWQSRAGGGLDGDFAIIATDESVDVFRLARGIPTAWHNVAAKADALTRCIESDLLANPAEHEPAKAVVIGPLDPAIIETLQRSGGIEVQTTDAQTNDPMTMAARAAHDALAGGGAGWVDFRRDALAATDRWSRLRTPLRIAAAMAIALPLLLVSVFFHRAGQYENMADSFTAAKAREYRKVHPGKPAPIAVRRILRAEWQRVSAVRGTGGTIPKTANALIVLRDAVAALPADIRLRVVQIDIRPSGLLLTGQVRRHSHAEILAKSLRTAGFIVDLPPSKRSGGHVVFHLKAKMSANENAAGGMKR